MKNDLPFFSHDNNASQHPKMKALIAEYGFEGYGRFWILNEKIARNSGAYIDISRKVYKLDLAKELNFNGDDLDKFLLFLSDPEIDLINICDNKITTDRINELYSITMEAREKARNKKQKKEKTESSSEKDHFPHEKTESSSEKTTEEIRQDNTKQDNTKQDNAKQDSCGSAKPPEKKQRKKSEKPRLRDREPGNDTEFVEKAYWTNWDYLYSRQLVHDIDPVCNWGQCRKLIKNLLDKNISPIRLADVVNKALQDPYILDKGYSLEKILAFSYVNGWINKITSDTGTDLILQTPIFNTAVACFEKDPRTKAILCADGETQKLQFQCLQIILSRCKNIMPDMPDVLLENIINHFRAMCNGKFKGKWTFTPRCLKTDWVWELVIDSLPSNAVTPELHEIIKGLFK